MPEHTAEGIRAKEPTFLDYWAILWRRKYVVLLILVVAVAAAIGIDTVQHRKYTATAQLLFLAQGSASTATNSAVGSLNSTQIATDIQLVQSRQVQAAVERRLQGQAPKVVVSELGTTQVADVTVTSTSPSFAAAAANAYAAAYVSVTAAEFVKSQLSTETALQSQLDNVQKQIAHLVTELGTVPSGSAAATNISSQLNGLYSQQTTLQSQLGTLRLSTEAAAGGRVIQPATVPVAPSSPKRTQDALIAALLGLLVGIGFALLLDHLDDRIRSKDDLETATRGLPTLALIPVMGEWKNPRQAKLIAFSRPKSPAAEAYRGLRTSIQFASIDRPIRTLQLTSPSSTDGKTTTAANLAWTLADAGQDVVLVDCDLRRPRVHEFFDLPNAKGLTRVLLGDTELSDALWPIPGRQGLKVLTSGPVPPNPSELLSAQATRDVLQQLANQADIVIIDSPPVLPVTDAVVLANHVDAVLMVVSSGISTRRRTTAALSQLLQLGAPVMGVVLNRTLQSDAYVYYGYRYGYGYGNGHAPIPSVERPAGRPARTGAPAPVVEQTPRRRASKPPAS